MTSIRTFLVVALLATITLTVFIAAVRGYRASLDQVENLFDEELEDVAGILEVATRKPPSSSSGDEIEMAFQIWVSGTLARKSDNTPDSPIAPFEAGYHDGNFGDYRWRILSRPTADNTAWVMVAERADLRFKVADEVLLEAVKPVILGLPAAGLLIWLIVGRGLRPLARLASELRLKRSDDLGLLPMEMAPTELRQVIQSTNALLQRLAASFEREKRFAADAAHELRTPISVLKVQLYNLTKDVPEDNANLRSLRDGIERLNHIIEQILALYRNTPEHSLAEFVRLDLYSLAQGVIGSCYGQFAARNQQIELSGSTGEIMGERFALETLIQNLLSNASKYTPPGGRILVSVSADNAGCHLRVEDSGPGIPEDERERVFERFYRIGGDRHESGTAGCGLGLAIVKHIVELHDARVTLGSSQFPSGLAVDVIFPRAPERDS